MDPAGAGTKRTRSIENTDSGENTSNRKAMREDPGPTIGSYHGLSDIQKVWASKHESLGWDDFLKQFEEEFGEWTGPRKALYNQRYYVKMHPSTAKEAQARLNEGIYYEPTHHATEDEKKFVLGVLERHPWYDSRLIRDHFHIEHGGSSMTLGKVTAILKRAGEYKNTKDPSNRAPLTRYKAAQSPLNDDLTMRARLDYLIARKASELGVNLLEETPEQIFKSEEYLAVFATMKLQGFTFVSRRKQLLYYDIHERDLNQLSRGQCVLDYAAVCPIEKIDPVQVFLEGIDDAQISEFATMYDENIGS